MLHGVAYEDVRSYLQTGDIVLFDGVSRISAMLKAAQRSQFSHVGMIIRPPESDLVLLLESTTLSNVPDAVTGVGVQGVQIVLLSERLAKYDGTAAVRLLNAPRSPSILAALDARRRELHGRPYEQRKWALLMAWLDLPGIPDAAADVSSLFCSELVADMMQCAGWLPTDPVAAEYIPRDFGEDNTVGRRLSATIPGAALADPVYIRA